MIYAFFDFFFKNDFRPKIIFWDEFDYLGFIVYLSCSDLKKNFWQKTFLPKYFVGRKMFLPKKYLQTYKIAEINLISRVLFHTCLVKILTPETEAIN